MEIVVDAKATWNIAFALFKEPPVFVAVTKYGPPAASGVLFTVKLPKRLPPDIMQGAVPVKRVPGVDDIVHVASVLSNPHPVTVTGVPGGPDHGDSSISGCWLPLF